MARCPAVFSVELRVPVLAVTAVSPLRVPGLPTGFALGVWCQYVIIMMPVAPDSVPTVASFEDLPIGLIDRRCGSSSSAAKFPLRQRIFRFPFQGASTAVGVAYVIAAIFFPSLIRCSVPWCRPRQPNVG